MSNIKISTPVIGYMANQVIQRAPSAVVSGTASRGIYLQPTDDLTIYLSLEEFRGPLTLNLSGKLDDLSLVEPGSSAIFQDSNLIFPDNSLQISLKGATIWQPSNALRSRNLHSGQLKKVFGLAQEISGKQSFFPLLNMVMSGESALLPEFPDFGNMITPILEEIQTDHPAQLNKLLIDLLGAGPGLTPVGDDFILGIMLSVNRLSESIFQENTLAKFNQSILDSAREKTTQLSFSLLTCAAEGSADERLLKVLDSLSAGDEIHDQDLIQMLNWGSSSGIAVLAGMVAVLTRIQR